MKAKAVISVLCVVLLAGNAWAGRPCTEFRPEPATVKNALLLADRARSALDEAGAEVALIARVGQDLSKYKLRYSHFGFVVRNHPAGPWIVVHELNLCGSQESGIFAEGLGNFFLDDMFAYETLILVPDAATQRRLAAMLASDRPLALHALPYNMLAFAYSTRYQNSNQWGLEVYAAAAGHEAGTMTRGEAQAWLKASGYRPSTIQMDTMTRLGARMFRANIAFDDHPFERRMAGQIDTVTVDSVFQFVRLREPDAREIRLALD
jgi:hypothetical protein